MDNYHLNGSQMILSEIRALNKPIVIFGAGVAGEALFHVCKDATIEVVCFCDNNKNKTKKLLLGIPVLHTLEIKEKVENPVFLISAADIFDVVEQLESFGFKEWHDSSQLLLGFDINRNDLSVSNDFAEYVISTCIACHQAFRNPRALFLRSVDMVITERCSLRCRDCANLMQYYKKPQNYLLEDILKSVTALAGIVDSINEIRVIGGEPLMSPAFPSVVKRLIDEEKFRRIIIYTNGTICPSEQCLSQLKHPKVLFYITHYGMLSKNIEGLTRRLDKLNIQRFVQMAQGWCECGTIKHHQRNENEKNTVFGNCCAKHLVTLMNGNLYRCPFSANAATLRAIPENPEEYVYILNALSQDQDLHSLRQEVLQLLSRQQPLQSCDYCEGRPYGAAEIKPAVQVNNSLGYQELFRRNT